MVSDLPVAKLLLSPWNRRDVVSKQVAPVPRLPDWKLLPSATLNRVGLLHRPEQGVACFGWQNDRHGSISSRQVVSIPACPSARHWTAVGFDFPWQNCASCPQAVIGSAVQSDGFAAGVWPFWDWNTERAAYSSPPDSTRSLAAYLICGCQVPSLLLTRSQRSNRVLGVWPAAAVKFERAR